MNNNQSISSVLSEKWHNLLKVCHFDEKFKKLHSMPNITRKPLKPHYWHKKNQPSNQKISSSFIGLLRRTILLVLIICQTMVGVNYLISLLPYQGWHELSFIQQWGINPIVALKDITPYAIESIIIGLFAILFAWISIGFWTAIMGIIVAIFGRDSFTIPIPKKPSEYIDSNHRTALVVPICNEDVARVFACIKANWQSLQKTGHHKLCDFYILSDTNDPDTYVNELKAWADLVDEIGLPNTIFYRHRERRVKRKSGNIDDFCRRFGKQYEYMIILDADSIMSGNCIVNMIAMMEMMPKAGIIQSPPKTVRMNTLYGRIQQFANQTYSDIFSSGVHYWQLSEAQYWGHNAIIRLKPFMEHCLLSPFYKRGNAHHILSHDLVEAALMRSAGWQVWIGYNLEGSYEEVPGNIIEDLKRDNRWCIGNLINLRVLFKPKIKFIHRVMFATSAMAYVSSLLWLFFLIFSTLLLLMFNVSEPQYFLHSNQFFPVWPRWDEQVALQLLGTTFALLLVPKLASYLIILLKQGTRSVGGIISFTLSILLEILFSIILAPIKMIFHSMFVIKAMFRSQVQWKSPARSDDALTWNEVCYCCWPLVTIGVIWLSFVVALNPQFVAWFITILVPLIISPLIAYFTSLSSIGLACKKIKLFLTKEETKPNAVIIDADDNLKQIESNIINNAYQKALIKPELNALVCAMSTKREHYTKKQIQYRNELLKNNFTGKGIDVSNELKLKAMTDPILFALLLH